MDKRKNILDNDKAKTAIKLMKTFEPMIREMIPERFHNVPLCKIILNVLNRGGADLEKFFSLIVYEKEEGNIYNNPINAFKSLCEFLATSSEDSEEVRRLLTVLKLPCDCILEKELSVNIAGVDLTATIKRCKENNITTEVMNNILLDIHTLIANFFLKKIKDVNFDYIIELAKTLN